MVQILNAMKPSSPCTATKMTLQETLPLKLDDSFAAKRTNEYLRLIAIAVCIASAIINLALCIAAIVFATVRHSPATFAFAADCALDSLSSVVVIWRYFGSPYSLYSADKENKACISLGILFVFAGLGVIIEGVFFLVNQDKPKWYTVLVILACTGAIACFLLGLVKYILYKKIRTESLFLDAFNSMLSGLFALVIIVGDIVFLYDENVWYLDPLLSTILAIILVAYGFRIMKSHLGRRDVDLASC